MNHEAWGQRELIEELEKRAAVLENYIDELQASGREFEAEALLEYKERISN